MVKQNLWSTINECVVLNGENLKKGNNLHLLRNGKK